MNSEPLSAKDHSSRRLRRLTTIWVGNGTPLYFLTVCTRDKASVLATPDVYQRMHEFSSSSQVRYGWFVLCFVLMPDHIHILARFGRTGVTVGAWIKALKAVVGRRELRWQNGFFDHVIRSEESCSEKWAYIRNNPVRKGLVAKAEDWPYARIFHPLTGEEIGTP